MTEIKLEFIQKVLEKVKNTITEIGNGSQQMRAQKLLLMVIASGTIDLSNIRLDPFNNDINKQWQFLRYADLTKANLSYANLQNSDLVGD